MVKPLIKRWYAPTPRFWKKVQRFCMAVASLSVVLEATTTPVPLWLSRIVLSAALLGTFLSQFTTKKYNDETNP